jgi:O-antigen ligase
VIDTPISTTPETLRRPGRAGIRSRDGEWLALGSAAAAIAFLPLLVPRGPANSAPVDVSIAMAIWLVVLWASETHRRLHFPYIVPAALFIVGGAIGALVGPVPGEGAKALAQDCVLIAWCWVIVTVGSSPWRLGVLFRTWVYSSLAWTVALFVGLVAGVPELTGQTARDGSRTSLTLADPNVAANYFFISIMLVWATGCPRRRVVRLAAYGLLTSALISTGSNEGLVALGLGVTVAVLAAVYKRSGVAPAFTGIAIVLATIFLAVALIPFGSLQERASGSSLAFVRDGFGRLDQSAALRGPLLGENIRIYRSSGMLGSGPVSTKARLEKEMAPFVKEAHNDYLAALNERGLLGLLGVVLLVAGVLLRAAAVVRLPLEPDSAPVVKRPEAVLGAVVGVAAVMSLYELLHVRHVWTLFALVAASQIVGTVTPRPEGDA